MKNIGLVQTKYKILTQIQWPAVPNNYADVRLCGVGTWGGSTWSPLLNKGSRAERVELEGRCDRSVLFFFNVSVPRLNRGNKINVVTVP